jgi:hypothetical protein
MAATAESPVGRKYMLRKEYVQSFPAEVRELLSSAHPKFYVRLPRKLIFKEVLNMWIYFSTSSREKS